ncbi:MAG TPA: heme-binding protein [Casimicrobiaceae bacterium]|nr:heme-binding protein [Casimicrobiaceae bacterium]
MIETVVRTAGIVCIAMLTLSSNGVDAQRLLATYPSLTTPAALKAAQAALAQCDKEGYTAAVAVVDRGGHALALLRNGLAGAHTVRTAIDKAATALSFRTDTTELAASTQSGRTESGVRELPNVVAIGGGMMIRAKGQLVGAIGVSGAPGGAADDVCAKVGIAAISDDLELE